MRWYHAVELPDGSVTPGWFDLRAQVHHYGLPGDLSGMRCLDVGTWDGFWAFEMEKRGAAEVVALDLDDEADLDWPPRRRPASFSSGRGDGFRELRARLGSSVERVELSVYDATPERLGSFDLVFCGSVLIHLRDQFLALERIASVCRGRFVSAEEYDRLTSLLPVALNRWRGDDPRAVVFWRPNARAWRRMLWSAGFDRVERVGRFTLRATDGLKVPHVVHHAFK
ncbi:MAG: class I SAM-dependent methyltransferase [Actinomycetota bacterium]|nr:class I SAM-dependent methyltransferase [Actinomycetota bacterium]